MHYRNNVSNGPWKKLNTVYLNQEQMKRKQKKLDCDVKKNEKWNNLLLKFTWLKTDLATVKT